MPLKKLTYLALYTCLSLAVYAIESAIPPLVPIPGIKLGLANIITLVLLTYDSPKSAAYVLTARLLLSCFLFGQLLSLLYSIAGGFLSLLVMCLVSRLLQRRKVFITGAMGGLTHNLGQLLIALLVTATPGVLAYLPFLIISGILTGLFTGLCTMFAGRFLMPHLPGYDRKR